MSRPPGDWGKGQGEPVPRHRRNPKRAYDTEGREIEPATIANARANGAIGLIAECECGHEARIPFAGLPDDAYVPDVALKLQCSACGARGNRITTWPDWTGARRGEA
ncbi:hypothetical protein [Methylobacterium symbioticum]|uniref:Uncharacterized protein n=1 Tax=Methylobacterium symbioticum TaxID=2584084 RepID=A0A509EC64_9HYPH|nr:hypothetical protein [Methylobacterium symbioticum]VUD71801.1 hypothetical protein MET9862_02389 [Methylobacterium symbioticum]